MGPLLYHTSTTSVLACDVFVITQHFNFHFTQARDLEYGGQRFNDPEEKQLSKCEVTLLHASVHGIVHTS